MSQIGIDLKTGEIYCVSYKKYIKKSGSPHLADMVYTNNYDSDPVWSAFNSTRGRMFTVQVIHVVDIPGKQFEFVIEAKFQRATSPRSTP